MNDRLARLFAPVHAGEYAPYAGIGSRQTPPEICAACETMGFALASRGFTVRSGGAAGADEAFEAGALTAGGATEIYLPRRAYRRSVSSLYPEELGEEAWRRAQQIAERFHGDWSRVRSSHARALLTRDSFQVLGQNLRSPSRFVIAWTEDGMASGGTGQAIRIAQAHAIPVLNLRDEIVLSNVLAALELG
jgi:hypothetical protein